MPILLVFHFALAQKHDVKDSGSKKVDGLDFSPYANIWKHLVAVTTDNIQPQMTVLKTFLGEKGEAKKGYMPDNLYQMFHYPTDKQNVFPEEMHG